MNDQLESLFTSLSISSDAITKEDFKKKDCKKGNGGWKREDLLKICKDLDIKLTSKDKASKEILCEKINNYFNSGNNVATTSGNNVATTSGNNVANINDERPRTNRPSPSDSATQFPVGTTKIGNDGNMYKVILTSNGRKRWVKSTDTVTVTVSDTTNLTNLTNLTTSSNITKENFKKKDCKKGKGGWNTEDLLKICKDLGIKLSSKDKASKELLCEKINNYFKANSDTVSSNVATTTSDTVSSNVATTTSDTVSSNVARTSDTVSSNVATTTSDTVSSNVATTTSDTVSDTISSIDLENLPTEIFNKNTFDVMLAHKYNGQNPVGYYISEKLDGYRAIFYNNQDEAGFMSRNHKQFNAPKWYIKDISDKLPKGFVLDGELYTKRGDFANMGIVRKKIPVDSEWRNVTFMVFDLPLIRKPFKERYNIMKKMLSNIPHIKVVENIEINDIKQFDKIHTRLVSEGAEGTMLRDPNSYYEQKRSNNLLKVKDFLDDEVIVEGMEFGEGRNSNVMGNLIVRWAPHADKKYKGTFNVGSGFTDEDRKEWKKLFKNGTIITIKYFEIQPSGKPRFPIYQNIYHNV
jgi:DNA ligase 1